MSSILMTNFMFSNGANEDIRIILSFNLLILCMYDTGISCIFYRHDELWWNDVSKRPKFEHDHFILIFQNGLFLKK